MVHLSKFVRCIGEMKRSREEWEAVVESIGSVRSKDALPIPLVPESLVPAVSVSCRQFLDAMDDQLKDRTFCPAVSLEEGFYSRPNADKDTTAPVTGHSGIRTSSKVNFMEAFGRDVLCAVPREENLYFGPRCLTQGFARRDSYNPKGRVVDFMPIIIVPSAPSAPVQLFNVRQLLEDGVYVQPFEFYIDPVTGAPSREDSRADRIIVSPGSFAPSSVRTCFERFKVVDNPSMVSDWNHVCCCFVTGAEWQFHDWYPKESQKRAPGQLFTNTKGYLPYFEEDKIPAALQLWNVRPMILTRKTVKANSHIQQARAFWEELFRFIDTHPFFGKYTIPASDGEALISTR